MEGAFSAPLLGATTLFAPRQDEGEATFLLPPQNRDEVFSQLLGAVKGELARRGVGSLLFTVDKKDTPLGDILRRRGTPYEFSEFFLEYVPGSEKTSDNPGNGITEVSLIPATLEDLSALAAINAEAFDGDVDTTLALFRNIIAQEDRQLFSICHESKKVGTVGIMEEQTQRYLFALAVKPALQGRGIGKAVLDRMVKRYGPGKKSLVLEVETKNTSALGLYKSSGFSVRSEFCYYRERIE